VPLQFQRIGKDPVIPKSRRVESDLLHEFEAQQSVVLALLGDAVED
jgi:hypothetical protein